MNSLLEAHKDRFSHCIIVFGMAGLIFYAALVVGSFLLKYGVQIFTLLKGMGL